MDATTTEALRYRLVVEDPGRAALTDQVIMETEGQDDEAILLVLFRKAERSGIPCWIEADQPDGRTLVVAEANC